MLMVNMQCKTIQAVEKAWVIVRTIFTLLLSSTPGYAYLKIQLGFIRTIYKRLCSPQKCESGWLLQGVKRGYSVKGID